MCSSEIIDSPIGSLDSVSRLEDVSTPLNLFVSIKSRSGSCSSELSEYSGYSELTDTSVSNDSICSPILIAETNFNIIDNPTDESSISIQVSRARLEYLEYLNANLSSIIQMHLTEHINSIGYTVSSDCQNKS
jgi:hypothetical protein